MVGLGQDIGWVAGVSASITKTGLLAGKGLVMLVRELRVGGGDGNPREGWDIPRDPLTKPGKEQHSLWPSKIL